MAERDRNKPFSKPGVRRERLRQYQFRTPPVEAGALKHPMRHTSDVLQKLIRLFTIKTRFEASAITYALALGAAERGRVYLTQFPGWGGSLLFLACLGTVALASAKIFECLHHERKAQSS